MKAFLSTAIIAAILLIASPVAAQSDNQICVSHADWAESLRMGWKERVIGSGMIVGGIIVELFASPNGEIWTILFTYPGGLTCAFASGEGWSTITPSPDEPAEPDDGEGSI